MTLKIGLYLEWFQIKMLLILGWRNHFAVTDFQRPRKCHSFSFNPKNRVFITTDEVSDFIFVAESVAKNVIFVTAVTNRPCNSLIINYAYRVQKLPWKVHDFLHRLVKNEKVWNALKRNNKPYLVYWVNSVCPMVWLLIILYFSPFQWFNLFLHQVANRNTKKCDLFVLYRIFFTT